MRSEMQLPWRFQLANMSENLNLPTLDALDYEIERRRRIPKLAFLEDSRARYKVAYSGRGTGKSWEFARSLLRMGAKRPLRIVCARETMDSIDESVHQILSTQIMRMGLDRHYIVQQQAIMSCDPITRKPDGGKFIFAGLRHNVYNIKSLEGANIVWVEEAQRCSKETWDTLVPTIREAGSEIWVSFNPMLEEDETYKRFVVSPPADSIVVRLALKDNPWFPETLRIESDDLLRRDPKSWDHVYGGECVSSITGAVYGSEMEAIAADKRITSVPYDRTRPVDTFWDLGYGDMTAIWFAQAIPGGWYHVVDYLEDCGHPIDHYLIQLQRRGYLYGIDWLPHDGVDTIIHKRLAGDKTRSVEMLMRNAGRNVRIVPKMLVHDGINAVRMILPQCRFDGAKCADGLSALRRYQWGEPNSKGVARREPLHDSASHGADAFRSLAIALKQPRTLAPVVMRPPARVAGGVWS